VSEVPDPQCPPWPQYAQAIVEFVLEDTHLILTPLPDEPVPQADTGSPLAAWQPPIWVLTAGDPYPEELTEAENFERLRILCAELDAAGITHDPALGSAPEGSPSEVSRALRGIDRAQACAIAARHGQLAVYEIDDHLRCVDVASGTVVTARSFRVRHAPTGDARLTGPTGWRG
jgi:hypothetical protein